MAHKKCLKKMREHAQCNCIKDDLKELKIVKKLLSKYFIKNLCIKLAKDTKSIRKIVNTIYKL